MPELLRPWLSRVPTPEAFVLLNQLGEVSRRVSAAYGAFLRPYGIDFSEYVLLWALRLHEPKLPAMSELRERVVMSSGGVALAVNRLERKRLVRRKTSEQDGRAVLVQLTGKGRRLIDELMAADLERHQALVEGLEPLRRTEVLDGLAEIVDRFRGTPEWG
jgi:DNA-binding MarR family transcriptional regulator